ncbi:MAG: hypothetical protein M3R58_17285 [Pseudomonadota bacterium]|nr:hypothetical protein [Pseudomonadota bacterium]
MSIADSIRAVIFDLDGTLVNNAGEIALALERTFGDLGLRPLGKGAVEALIGRGVHSLVERALALAGLVRAVRLQRRTRARDACVRPAGGHGRGGRGAARHTRSMTSAMPWPTPMHIVHKA